MTESQSQELFNRLRGDERVIQLENMAEVLFEHSEKIRDTKAATVYALPLRVAQICLGR